MAVDYLFIVRHGETKANEDGIEAGPRPYPLAKKGVRDVRFIAKTLSKIKMSAVYSSPLFRAVETAKILAKPQGLKVKTLDELTEAKFKPEYIGKNGRHHILTDPEAFSETNDDLLKRTAKAIESMRKEASGNVIAVSHGDVISAMLEGVVERSVGDKRYYVLHPDYHRKMFAGF